MAALAVLTALFSSALPSVVAVGASPAAPSEAGRPAPVSGPSAPPHESPVGLDLAGPAHRVAIALDGHYVLAGSTAKARIALHGRTSEAFTALVAVVSGHAMALGLLPAAVGRFPLGTGCPA